jgi:hypothetical protein
LEQNAKLHTMCRDIAKQLVFDGEKLDEVQWKLVFLAAKCGQKIMKNPFTGHGVIVVNNKRSSRLNAEEFTELLGEIEAFGAYRGVDWSDDEPDR